jgi:threonine/homoserine/homoserine lactone efflux protein
MRSRKLSLPAERSKAVVRRGFLTAFLNPKGMMIYFAILPQFMQHEGGIAMQATILSVIFIGLCGIVYAALSVAIASASKRSGFSDRRRRWVEGVAGGVLVVAAGRLAVN